MRLMLILVCFVSMLFSQGISEKLIISADTNISTAQMHLLKLKMFFLENTQTRALQEDHNVTLLIEILDDYSMVVIKPIKTVALKNELLLLLSPHFPDIFAIHENKVVSAAQYQKDTEMFVSQVPKQTENLINEIGLQWIALLLLSMIGLVLSVNSRRKMASLESMQKDLSQKQEEIENEIKHLGTTHV